MDAAVSHPDDALKSNNNAPLPNHAGHADHADHANSPDDTAVSKDARATGPKENTGFVLSKDSAGSHRVTPDTTQKCHEASPQSSPSDENMAKDNDSPENNNHHDDMGDKKDEKKNEKPPCRCYRCRRSKVFNPGPRIPPDQRKRWPKLCGESPLYSQPPWHHGRRPRVPFAEWMFYQPSTATITSAKLVADVRCIYAGYVMVESLCMKWDADLASRQQIHDIDVVPFLEVIPGSVLIQLQRANLDPEEIVRNALNSSRGKIELTVKRWKRGKIGVALRGTINAPIRESYLHVPTIEESFHGFLVVWESRAKGSRSPERQALRDLTTRTLGHEGRAKVEARQNVLTVGRDLLTAVDKATDQAEQAERNIHATPAEMKTPKAKDQAEQGIVKAKNTDDEKAKQKKNSNNNWKPLPLPADSRPLDDESQYKKIGEVYYYKSSKGRWMNISHSDHDYRALVNLHRTSLREMYDLLLASRHPQAPESLRRVSAEYSLPRRLWRHNILNFLDVLVFRLTESSEHLLFMIHSSYSMMQLIEETIPMGSYTMERLGDLARYRYFIEHNAQLRLHWKAVTIQQYNRALDFDPAVGWLHTYLSILSRDHCPTLSLFHIIKAMSVSQPCTSAWDTMVNTILGKFVAPEGQQTFVERDQTLALDEENLYTIIAHLILASRPSAKLQKCRFDTCRKTNLLEFDGLLWFVAGIRGPKSTLPSTLRALFHLSLSPQTSGAKIHLTPSLVGPASHYSDPTCYIRGKTIPGPAPHTTRGGGGGGGGGDTVRAESTPSLSTGMIGWVTDRFCQHSSTAFVQSYAVRPSPELGLLLCRLLWLDIDFAVTNRAAQLLSVVNLRILTRPVTHDLKLWQYLHVLLVVMRSMKTQPDVMKRFRYAFHPGLMAPLLNILLRRLKGRGGDAWEALFRPEFPIRWVPLNTKDKSEKYGRTATDAQREYLLRRQKHEVESSMVDDTRTETTEATGAKQEEQETGGTKTDNAAMLSTGDRTEIAAEDSSGAFEMVASNVEDNTQVAAEVRADKLETNLEPGNVKRDHFRFEMVEIGGVVGDSVKSETDSVQPALPSKAGVVGHGSEDNLATSQDATAHDVVSESNGGLESERLFTLVLPEDRLLRGFCFAKETPSPPQPEQPPSEKQVAREKFDEEKARMAKLKKDRADRQAETKRQRDNHKQQRRIARGVDSPPHMQICADCRSLAESGETKRGSMASVHAANSKVCQEGCQECRGRHRVGTPVSEEATETAGRSPQVKPDTVVEAAEEQSEDDGTAAPADVPEDNTTPANKPSGDVTAEAVESTELISDDAQAANWVVVNTADIVSTETDAVVDTVKTVVKDATDVLPQESEDPDVHANESATEVLPQESEDPDVHANESATEELPDLALLFHVADEVAETVVAEENASPPTHVTKPDHAYARTTCEEEGKTDSKENNSSPPPPPTATDPETDDYGIRDMFARTDAEATQAALKAREARERARKAEEALRLNPYFYPPGFFENSKLGWEDFLTSHDYAQDVEMADYRELRILWTAFTTEGFFDFHQRDDENGDCCVIIDVPGESPVPRPRYPNAPMPVLATRDDGSKVVYVDPTVAVRVAETDALWKLCAEESDRRRREYQENRKREEEEEEKEEEKERDNR